MVVAFWESEQPTGPMRLVGTSIRIAFRPTVKNALSEDEGR